MEHRGGALAGAPLGQNCRWPAHRDKQGQGAHQRLLPFFWGGDAAAPAAEIRKILKNNALAVILP